ncbi:MAG: ATP-dependent RecD-like DNA helicase [Puniceicoccales bacterium]|jgi:exodeoxyribonuclease V alpha subunit|nr:ATP-dependent RecD-like DNA helicase [Puniceicoccales bacterium]
MSAATAANAAETLTGVLERIVFLNEENHYTVGELKVETDNGKRSSGTATILGSLPGVQCGETLELAGAWVTHREHGPQFKIASFRSKLPATVYGIRKYLGSGLVKGIGKTYAEKIVAKFGEQTLRIISEQSARLREVPGIGAGRAKAIKKAWDEQSALRDVMVFLQTYGVTTAQCLRIVKKYDIMSRIVIESNPYQLASEIDGIGFLTADRIARNLGLPTEGTKRLEAGVRHALTGFEEDGHTAVPREKLAERAAAMLEVPREKIDVALDALAASRDLRFFPRYASDSDPLVQNTAQARAEEDIAACVNRLLSHPSALPPILVDRAVSWAQDKAGFAFAPAQAQAVRTALTEKFSILTGGPGTGKTTILSALCAILSAKKARIVLAAPTGRAAQRMAETTRLPASTIHRLLKYAPDEGRFQHNAEHPVAADIIVVDEASMLDNRLAAALLRAVHAHTHLLLVGDVHQLPSVGPGNVLQDLIASRRVAVTTLTAIYRQGARSQIVGVAHDILAGRVSLPPPLSRAADLDPHAELQSIATPEPENCIAQITALCADILPRQLGLDPWRDIQVLAPMHKGAAGISSINAALQQALRPAPPSQFSAHGAGAAGGFAGASARPAVLGVGDKVIQTRNNYDKGVFNGDLGRVSAVAAENGVITVDFDGVTADYERSELSELQLAYAISIHKSQGSEFNTVLIPLLKSQFVMLQRNLIYTALTRGRKRVIFLGDPAAYALAVRNTESASRLTALPFRLAEDPASPAAHSA